MTDAQVYVARQAIFDVKKNVVSYELLFRDSMNNFVPQIDGDIATSKLLANSFLTIGIDQLTKGKKAFINFTENLILKKVPLLLPKQTTVIEILEDVLATPEIIKSCKEIAQKGYTIALDDFIYDIKMAPLIEIANIIKIDFRTIGVANIKDYIKPLGKYKKLKLLAEKVETNEEFKQALLLGFELFQGYFFCKPEIIKGRDIPSSKLSLIQIIAEVNKKDLNFDKIRAGIEHDLSISYKLLRYINSAFFKRWREISSIKEALMFMGKDEIQKFVSMIAITNISQNKTDELVAICYTRAKFCELAGRLSKFSRIDSDELFTLGLFSLIDAMLDQPMQDIMEKLPLKQSIIDALVHGTGELYKYLNLVKSYEQTDWQAVSDISNLLEIDEKEIPSIYIQACKWSNTLSSIC